jgi:hypothetical protein
MRCGDDEQTKEKVTEHNKTNKLHCLSPRANYTDRATAACRRSDCQLLRIEGKVTEHNVLISSNEYLASSVCYHCYYVIRIFSRTSSINCDQNQFQFSRHLLWHKISSLINSQTPVFTQVVYWALNECSTFLENVRNTFANMRSYFCYLRVTLEMNPETRIGFHVCLCYW